MPSVLFPPAKTATANATSTSTATVTATDASSISTRSAEEIELIRQLDASADRVRAHISDEPYVLTIPQDEPKFHHYSRYAADSWLINTPFDASENYQVQYQTFLYRDPYSDVFERVRYSQFDRSFKPALVTALPQVKSATATPKTGPKKKISLAAYKNKQAQGAISTPLEKGQRSEPPTTADAARNLGKEKELANGPRPNAITPSKPLLRHVENDARRKHTPAAPNPLRSDVPASQPTKKPRPSSPPSPAFKVPPLDSQQKPRGPREALKRPPLSIPVERLSPLDDLYLKGPLSPTLPPTIEAALDEKENALLEDSKANDESVRPRLAAPRPASKHDSVLSHTNDVVSENTSSNKAPEESADTKPSHIFVIPIPKSSRPNIRRLLQFPPRPAKLPKPEQPSVESSDEAHSPRSNAKPAARKEPKKATQGEKDEPTKGLARKVDLSSKTVTTPTLAPPLPSSPAPISSGKRPRAPDDDALQPQAKRKKVPPPVNVDKNPSTPANPEFRSPALPHSSIKSQQATPLTRKDRPITTMKHVGSTESMNNMTPHTHDRTPVSSKASGAAPQNANARPSPLSNTAKTPESQAWAAEHARLSSLAKELKHTPTPPDSTSTHANPSDTSTSLGQKRATETATLAHVESILAFILSFYCHDRSLLCRSPKDVPDPANWVSCHGWYNLVLARCSAYPHLRGILAYLGVAYNGVILRRYTSGFKPDAQRLHEAVSGALRAADHAAARLPLATLKNEYPTTWKRGRLSAGGAEVDAHVKPGRYEGGFSLNVGIQMEPLEAVRLCHGLLAEWCANKGVDYKLRLKLSP